MAAGGSGAKTIEALVHLCAAGLGPEKLDVLLLDVDQNNGNSKRCQGLLNLYQHLQKAGSWRARPSGRAAGAAAPDEIHFFRTRITAHYLHESVEIVNGGGLHLHLLRESGALPVLDLLFDEDEQSSQCEKGFMARPNLGSLILAQHLLDAFYKKGSGASSWKDRLSEAIGANAQIPVFVIGSVFGGTGASLIPIACQCLQQALEFAAGDAAWNKTVRSAVMLLPYFHPASKPNDKVDASRFHADTITTLTHYERSSALDAFNRLYLVGSDDSSRNALKYCEGASDQANPCHLEEFIAASAVLHGSTQLEVNKDANLHWVDFLTGANFNWAVLPHDSHRLGLFAHFCAFLLAPTDADSPLASGMLSFIRDHSEQMPLLPLVKTLLEPWAKAHLKTNFDPTQPCWSQLTDATKSKTASVQQHEKQIAEYAWRFLLWADHALPTKGEHSLVEFGHTIDYGVVWEVLCGLDISEIDPESSSAGDDNTLIRLCRAAACALEKIATGQFEKKPVVLNAPGNQPVFPGSKSGPHAVCRIPLDKKQLKEVGANHKLRENIHDEYSRTANLV